MAPKSVAHSKTRAAPAVMFGFLDCAHRLRRTAAVPLAPRTIGPTSIPFCWTDLVPTGAINLHTVRADLPIASLLDYAARTADTKPCTAPVSCSDCCDRPRAAPSTWPAAAPVVLAA